MNDKHCFDCKYGEGWKCTHPNRECCIHSSLWWPKEDNINEILTDEGKRWFKDMCMRDLDRGEYE